MSKFLQRLNIILIIILIISLFINNSKKGTTEEGDSSTPGDTSFCYEECRDQITQELKG